ncbi:MAG: acyltransferase, partial [Methylotenera sp.]
QKGYLGVDIFFVISGFLITGLIMRQLAMGTFSFKSFYIRRARRLLPASLTTLLVTTALSFLLLTPADFDSYANQLTGALTFTANFFLAQQTDYFASKAETKPLLHIWSLSLEEQYYFIAPVLLWLTPLRRHAALIVLTGVASIFLCLIFVNGL